MVVPFITPSVTKKVLAEIQRAGEMNTFIQKVMPHEFVLDTDEKLLVAGIFSLTMEHHGAILYLLSTGQFDGSALALVRPLIDGAYRAHWIYSCAKPDIVLRITQGENVYPGLINMADEVEKKMETDGFFTSIGPYIHALHGYTHGGLEQLGRRFGAAGEVMPNYADSEKIEAIQSTTSHITALAMAWCELVSAVDPRLQPRSKTIRDRYVALYPMRS